MSHARIEEVSDSDPSEGDISDVSDDFDEREILKQRAPANASQSIINPSSIPSTTNTPSSSQPPFSGTPSSSKSGSTQAASRRLHEGRSGIQHKLL